MNKSNRKVVMKSTLKRQCCLLFITAEFSQYAINHVSPIYTINCAKHSWQISVNTTPTAEMCTAHCTEPNYMEWHSQPVYTI